MSSYIFSLEEIQEASHEGMGFCISCGCESAEMVEPDARKYHCEECDTKTVYGADEILIMGLVE